MELVLIGDERIEQVVARECYESFIDLRNYHPYIAVDETQKEISSNSPYFCFARKTLARMLCDAASLLPNDYRILIKECYRPPSQQKESFDRVVKKVTMENVELASPDIYRITSQYVAPITTAPHPTGAAVDLTLMTTSLVELDMGTEFNAEPWDTAQKTYFHAEHITGEQRANRDILSKCLEPVGFVNYEPEWWHWSYGDRYWAFNQGVAALYTPVEEKDMLSWITNE